MADNKKVVTVFVRIFVAPESIPVFVQALKSCVNHCLEEPECERFEVFQSAEGEFYLLETWTESKEWFIKEQLTKSYYLPYLAITRPLWVKERIIEYLAPVPEFEPFFRAAVK